MEKLAEVKWIKIVTDIFDDEKMLMIEALPNADSIIVIWFKLLCLAGKTNNNGVFLLNDRLAYTDEMLAAVFRRDVNIVRMAIETFEKLNMIEVYDGVITIPNWEKHQTLDAYEKKKARDRIYQAERRTKQKALIEKSSDNRLTSDDASSSVVVTDIDKDIEEDKDIKEKDKPKGLSKKKVRDAEIIPPTYEMVKEYCDSRNNGIDPGEFIDFYTSKGWVVGKGKMKDWQACIRTWERKRKEKMLKESKPQTVDRSNW